MIERGDAFLLCNAFLFEPTRGAFGVVLHATAGNRHALVQLQNGTVGLLDVDSIAAGKRAIEPYAVALS